VLGFQTIMCQGYGSSHDGGVEKWSYNDIGVAKARIPSFIFWYHNTFVGSFSWRVGIMWTNPYMMDVSCGVILSKIETFIWEIMQNLKVAWQKNMN